MVFWAEQGSDEYAGLVDPAFALMRTSAEKWKRFRQRIWERDGGVCGLCGGSVPLDKMHLGHVIPQADGGPDHWDNLRVTHPGCNMRRNVGRPKKPWRRLDGRWIVHRR